MKIKDQIRAQILAASADGSKVEKIETQPKLLAKLREELGLAKGAAVEVEGVKILDLPLRDQLMLMAISYTAIRWRVQIDLHDVVSLLKAIPDDELLALIPIVIDQHLDDNDFEDPLDEYDVESVDATIKKLREVGFVDVEI